MFRCAVELVKFIGNFDWIFVSYFRLPVLSLFLPLSLIP